MLWWPEAVRTAAAAGRSDIATRLVDDALGWSWCLREVRETLTALRAETGGDLEAAVCHYAQAAAGWEEWVFPYEQGQSCLRLGHCLVTLGRAKDAAGPLRKAREIFVRLHAGPALSTTCDLIERAGGRARRLPQRTRRAPACPEPGQGPRPASPRNPPGQP